jgi:hypothetical protein
LDAITRDAVKPLIQKYEHNKRVESAVRCLSILDGTTDDNREAHEVVQEALLALPVDASDRQFEQAKENALAPIRTRIEARLQQERDEADRQALIATSTPGFLRNSRPPKREPHLMQRQKPLPHCLPERQMTIGRRLAER